MMLIIGWILWIAGAQVAPRLPPPSATATAALEGTVFQAGANEPIVGATVSLTPVGRAGKPTAVTDADGKFSFRALEPGQYTIAAAHDGYRNPTSPGPLVILSDRQKLTDLVLRMTRVPTISGAVFNHLGEPLAAATVQAYRVQYTTTGHRLTFVKSALTNDFGEYRLFWLDPGDYTIAANYGQRAPRPAEVLMTPNLAKPDDGYATFYYPEAPTPHEARAIHLTGGVDESSINIGFREVPVFSISGRVSWPPIEDPYISDLRLAFESTGVDPGPELTYPITPNIQGLFEIRGVTPGAYYIVGTAKGKTGRLFSDVIGVDVANQDVKGVAVPLFVTTPISGNISVSDGVSTAMDLSGLKVNLVRSDGQPGPRPAALSMARGNFTIPDVPAGDYDVLLESLPSGSYLDVVRLGFNSAGLLSHLRIDPSRPPENLALSLSFAGGQVNGRAIDRTGNPLAGALVVLVPDPVFRKRPDRYLLGVADSSGMFSVAGIPPGSYSAFAFERVEAGVYYDPEFIQRFIGQSAPVRVMKGGLVNVDLRVVAADETGGSFR